MTSARELSVEIFRDAETPNVPLRDAEFAVMRMRRIVTGINIVRTRRLVTLRSSPDGRIDLNTFPRSTFEADLNVVMSDRQFAPLDEHEPIGLAESTLGYAHNVEPEPDGLRVAVVNALRSDPEATVMHEFGHLLDVEHCKSKVCIMHSHHNPTRKQFVCHDCNGEMKTNAARLALAKFSAELYV